MPLAQLVFALRAKSTACFYMKKDRPEGDQRLAIPNWVRKLPISMRVIIGNLAVSAHGLSGRNLLIAE